MKICLVTTVHIQPSKKWIDALPNCDIIIVDDSDGKVEINKPNVRMFDYKKQKELLGDLYEGFEKFHKSSSCKNFGNWVAYNEGYDIVIGIDSDCVCPIDIIEKHLKALDMEGYGWANPLYKIHWYPRGFPYSKRGLEVVANMGLWEDTLDINGKDVMIANEKLEKVPYSSNITGNSIVTGKIPFSGMNWACKREYLPYLMFLPNFDHKGLKFRRHDDIFGGYIFQKFLEKMGKCMSYGEPIIKHETELYPIEDAIAETAMNNNDDEFYQIIDEAFSVMSPRLDLLRGFKPILKGTKFEELESSIKWWKRLWKK
jgi:hypothetical protein